MQYHFIQEQAKAKEVTVLYTKTAEQLADMLTKALASVKHQHNLQLVNLGWY